MLRRGQTSADDAIEARAPTGGVPAGLVPAPRRPPPGEDAPRSPQASWGAAVAEPTAPPPVPRRRGDPHQAPDGEPAFRTEIRGYDRRQVDDHIARLEGELRAQRRATDELVSRYRDCAADLELSRRLLAHTAEAQHLLDVSQQAGRLLATAADQAAEVAAAGVAEAHRVVAEARVAAQASLDRARLLRERTLALCGSMRRQAQQDRAQAREVLARARLTADPRLRGAAEAAAAGFEDVSPPPAR